MTQCYKRTTPKMSGGERERETRYNSEYLIDVEVAVLIFNETHSYMLHIILIIPTVLHSKCLLARSLLLACPS